MSKWTLEVQESPTGDQFIEFPPEALEQVGWKEGDEIEWTDNGDGSWTLTKKEEEKVWVMVEALQTFRMRYMVQVPASSPEWALDTVTCNEAKEFSQLALPEVISSHRVMTEEEALAMCDVDNDYTKSWTKEQKIKAFFTKDGEEVER
jgi:bifunctional DNA-binding transcriptional regulator/antitoxin component of YhaV-PrlF toxin-antitoxin module